MVTVFITGSTEGLGLASARSLLDMGHRVVLHARNDARADALAGLRDRATAVVVGDLSDATQVRSVADQVNALGRMDAVIHNAGLYRVPERGSTAQGHAVLTAVNTLAPYLLTAWIERPARLVYLSSDLHRGGAGPLDDLDWTERPWDAARAYAESKLHLVALAAALSRMWPEVRSNAVDPGWVRTRMGGGSAPRDLEAGQRTQTWLAVTDDPAAEASGGYWRDLARRDPSPDVSNVEFQQALLDRLAGLTGVRLT